MSSPDQEVGDVIQRRHDLGSARLVPPLPNHPLAFPEPHPKLLRAAEAAGTGPVLRIEEVVQGFPAEVRAHQHCVGGISCGTASSGAQLKGVGQVAAIGLQLRQ